MDRIGVRQAARDQRVTAFVIGHANLFILGNDARLLFESGDDAVDPFLELVHGDELLVGASSQQRGFVDEVR